MSIRRRALRRRRRFGGARRGWRGRRGRRRRCAGWPGVPRVSGSAREGPPLADLGGFVDRELAGLDDPDAAVWTDHDLLPRDEVRDRALEVDLPTQNPIRAEFAAAPEEPAGPADSDLGALDHGHAHVPPELDLDLLRFQGSLELAPAGEPELLRGRPPAHAQVPSDVELAGLDVAPDGEGAGAVDFRPAEAAVHLRGAGGVGFLCGDVALEDPGTPRLREIPLEGPK